MPEKQPGARTSSVDSRIFIGKTVGIRIDRPIGSPHPEHEFIYPVNYGYVPGVAGLDGEELDAYVLGVDVPVERFTGRCIAVIQRLNDADDKLVIVPDGENLTDEQIRGHTAFKEQFFESIIAREGTEPP